jgi:GNAT superfamily N-acetyltransferase
MISIHLLKDKQEYINRIAHINFNTWYDFYDDNAYEDITCVDEYIEYLKQNCYTDKFPVQLVAVKNENNKEEYVGSVSLIDDDFPEISRDKIWITELYVEEKHRNNGIAKLLIKAALDIAKEKNLKEIYLSCLDNLYNYYEKLGFKYSGININFNNKKYNVFNYKLN